MLLTTQPQHNADTDIIRNPRGTARTGCCPPPTEGVSPRPCSPAPELKCPSAAAESAVLLLLLLPVNCRNSMRSTSPKCTRIVCSSHGCSRLCLSLIVASEVFPQPNQFLRGKGMALTMQWAGSEVVAPGVLTPSVLGPVLPTAASDWLPCNCRWGEMGSLAGLCPVTPRDPSPTCPGAGAPPPLPSATAAAGTTNGSPDRPAVLTQPSKPS
eukprot:COSAG01_NODE_7762_length_3063_cov_1.228437_2_plen_212_part_00